ncbi:glycosyltransferase family 4 protein [Klebsiella grimontii]|uniref:glycosyltransferase family 4 protein n=1 Tax=Klebsiella grimontii TaxID=2058152 RepID=UPI0006691E20|nr:glycosyltransferase family 1 protein [Klebsiella grimontii]TYF89119.1 glycosyltransferase family 1 protein [Klebsiella grimontii]
MKRIYIDGRWVGMGGIGTFYSEVNKILKFDDAGFKGMPHSPLDTVRSSLKLWRKKNSIYLFPGYIPPLFSRCPYIFTIHDLNHLDRPENSSLIKRLFYQLVIKRGCKKASYIFTVSDFSKQRIIEWSGVEHEKVITVGNGVSKRFSASGETMSTYDFQYFLCVGNRKLHKNEIRVIEAFSSATISKDIKLVLTGNADDAILGKIKELNLSDRVIFSGYISDADLPKLYRGAFGLIFASLYEGFGLPVIEAMASGVPVITSKTTSLGEVAGDAAILVDPENVIEIREAIELLHNNSVLRDEMIYAGFIQAKKYNWENVAERIKAAICILQ